MISALTALGKQIVQTAKTVVFTPPRNFYHRTVVVKQDGFSIDPKRIAIAQTPSKTFIYTIASTDPTHKKIEDAAKIKKSIFH